MKEHKVKNRYGDEYTFSLQEDETVLWKGNFKYCRYGFPNDYTKAFLEYTKDTGGGISLEQFEELVHAYDEVKKSYVLVESKYRDAVISNTTIITMVDPSGGPYLTSGMKIKKICDKEICRFERVKEGYRIYFK